MRDLKDTFRKSVAAGYGWVNRHKIASLAVLGLTVYGGNTAFVQYRDNAVSDPVLRDKEWAMLQADIGRAMAAKKETDAVAGLKEFLEKSPDKAAISVDAKKLEENLKALWTRQEAEEETLGKHFSFAANISLADMATIRQELNGKLYGWSFKLDLDNDPSNSTIRSCQKYVLSEKKHFWGEAQEDLRQCIGDSNSTDEIGRVLLEGVAIMMLIGAYAGAGECHSAVEAEKKQLARAQKTQAAAAPGPLVLNAPTSVSAPLKLRLKPKFN